MTEKRDPIRLFYVDDDEEDVMLMREYLSEIPGQSFVLENADNFEAAQVEITRDIHDIYIFDYRLGHRSGAELLDWAIAQGCDKPIILLTGYASSEIDAEALERGAADYLDKSMLSAQILDHAIRYGIARKGIEARLKKLLVQHARAEEQLRISERRARNILENIVEAVITTDQEGVIQSSNPAATDMFGYREAEMIGMNASRLCAPPHGDLHDSYIARYVGSGEKRIIDRGFREAEGRHKSGEVFPIELAISDLVRGDRHIFIATIRDIRDRKRVEAAQAEARKQAEGASQAKSLFLANISHELRTPLNAMLGFAEMIAKQLQGPLPEKYMEYAQNILQSGEHLMGLVSDLLDLSRVEEGKVALCLEEVFLPDLIISCKTLLDKKAEEEGITIIAHAGRNIPLISVDSRRIRQVVINLLDNAIKFSPAGSEIQVETRLLSPDEILLEVQDQGRGIPPGKLDLALQKFVQLHPQEHGLEQDKGAGLGLALVKGIVKLHNGRLDIESEPDKGTIVRVALPVRQAESGSEPEPPDRDHLP